MESAICYTDRDNRFTLTLKKNNVTLTEVEMNAITKFEIKFMGAYFNSVDDSSGFVVTAADGTVLVKPYELGFTTAKDTVELLVYDAGEYTHGLMWDKFKLHLKADTILST